MLRYPELGGPWGGTAQHPATHEKHKVIDFCDSVARLENSHGRATKLRVLRFWVGCGASTCTFCYTLKSQRRRYVPSKIGHLLMWAISRPSRCRSSRGSLACRNAGRNLVLPPSILTFFGEGHEQLDSNRDDKAMAVSKVHLALSKKNKGGETQGRRKHTIKPLPRKGFGPLPLMIRFPPPLCSRNVILLRGSRHRTDKSHFLRPLKLGLEGALYSTFPPPPKSHDTFWTPLCEFPTLSRVASAEFCDLMRLCITGRGQGLCFTDVMAACKTSLMRKMKCTSW